MDNYDGETKSGALQETEQLLHEATSEVEKLRERIDGGVSELEEMIETLNGLTGTMNQLEEDMDEADNCETAYDAVSHAVDLILLALAELILYRREET